MFKNTFLIKNKEVISNYYNAYLIINYLLKEINDDLLWIDDLERLFLEFSNIPKDKM
jgi:hypothetical protein